MTAASLPRRYLMLLRSLRSAIHKSRSRTLETVDLGRTWCSSSEQRRSLRSIGMRAAQSARRLHSFLTRCTTLVKLWTPTNSPLVRLFHRKVQQKLCCHQQSRPYSKFLHSSHDAESSSPPAVAMVSQTADPSRELVLVS